MISPAPFAPLQAPPKDVPEEEDDDLSVMTEASTLTANDDGRPLPNIPKLGKKPNRAKRRRPTPGQKQGAAIGTGVPRGDGEARSEDLQGAEAASTSNGPPPPPAVPKLRKRPKVRPGVWCRIPTQPPHPSDPP